MNPSPIKSRKKRWQRFLAVFIGVGLVLFVGAELFARFYLGLGDPPLVMNDPQTRYIFRPNQDVRRFGQHIKYNAYSMRSDDFPAHKTDPQEVRVLVVGDSVINGGVLTDQADLATELLKKMLLDDLHRSVIVGNVSTGGWGIVSKLGYIKKYGILDVDVVVLISTSNDYAESPWNVPIAGSRPSFPDHKPVLALQEAVFRYLPRYLPLPQWGSDEGPLHVSSAADERKAIAWSQSSLREFIALVRQDGAKVVVAQHPEVPEVFGKKSEGYERNRRTIEETGATRCEFGPVFAQSMQAGLNPYRDEIHVNVLGQRLIARTLLPVIEKELAGK